MIFRLFIIISLLFLPLRAEVKSSRLSDHDSLMLVLEMIYTASFDFDRVYRIEEEKLVELVDVQCREVKASFLKEHINSIFEIYQSFYPDDDLPFEEALDELDHVLSGQDYLKCSKSYRDPWEKVELDYYRPLKGGSWITVEYRSVL